MSDDAADDEGSTGTAEATHGNQRTVGDILGEDRSKRYIKYNVGVFVAVGLGFAVALVLMDGLIGGGSSSGTTAQTSTGSGGTGSVVLVGALFVFLFAPLVSGLTGSVTALRLNDTEKAVATVASAGAFVGFLGFLVLLIVIASAVGPSGSSNLFTEELLAMIGWGVGVSVAGGGTAFVTERFA